MPPLPRQFWYLWTGALINALGGFVRILLALYLTTARHFSVAHAGLVVSLFGVGMLAASPTAGFFADRIGRRATMLAGFLLGAASMVQLALAREPSHIAVSALLVGFCNELFRPAQQAMIADLVPPAGRLRAYGYIYWAVNIGFSGAAMLAGWLASHSFTLAFLADAATTLVFGLIVLSRVPETHPERHVERRQWPDPRVPFGDGVFMAFIASQLLVATIGVQHGATLPLEMARHGVSSTTYGSLMAINGVLIVLLQPSAVRLVRHLRRGRALALAALLQGLGFGLSGLHHSPAWFAFTIVVWTVAELLYSPLTPTVVADLAPAHLRGSYQGVLMMTFGASWCLAPLVGSAVLDRLGSHALWGGCFVVGAIATAMHLGITPARRRRLVALGQVEGVRREDGD